MTSSHADDARAELLARVRDALRPPTPMGEGEPSLDVGGEATLPEAWTEGPPPATILPVLEQDDLIDRFAERVAEYRATVLRADAPSVADTLASAVASWGARRIVVPEGFPDAWLATAAMEFVRDQPPLSRDALDAVDGVVSTCALGIAETGTIVLDASAGQGRRALSLLPDRHLCVIRTEQIVQDVPDAIELLDPRRPLTWISGPSATSDIELQRVEGVHGPRTLVVVIVGSA